LFLLTRPARRGRRLRPRFDLERTSPGEAGEPGSKAFVLRPGALFVVAWAELLVVSRSRMSAAMSSWLPANPVTG
jgi:hypothetical protein